MMKNFSQSLRNSFLAQLPFILVVCTLFIAQTADFLMYGMSLDGTVYYSVALNLAHHIGTLWKPVFSQGLFPFFYEHPPLGIYFTSFFFKLFGSSIFVDKFHAFILVLLNMLFFIGLWATIPLKSSYRLVWLPLFCWLSVFANFNSIKNGYLEGTLTLFTYIAVILILKVLLSEKKHGLLLLLAGLSMATAFFVNGPQALFPLGIPFLYWIVFKQTSSRVMVNQTLFLGMVLFSTIGLVLLYPPAFENLKHYFLRQLMPILNGQDAANTKIWQRFYIFWMITREFLILLILTPVLLVAYLKSQKLSFSQFKTSHYSSETKPWLIFLVLVGLSASLPILVSSRQGGHYYLAAFPFFILIFAYILSPLFESWIPKIKVESVIFKSCLGISVLLLITALGINYYLAGKISPGRKLLKEVNAITQVVPPGSTISVPDSLYSNWDLHAFLYRYGNITLMLGEGYPYFLDQKEAPLPSSIYQRVPSSLTYFTLFQKVK